MKTKSVSLVLGMFLGMVTFIVVGKAYAGETVVKTCIIKNEYKIEILKHDSPEFMFYQARITAGQGAPQVMPYFLTFEPSRSGTRYVDQDTSGQKFRMFLPTPKSGELVMQFEGKNIDTKREGKDMECNP